MYRHIFTSSLQRRKSFQKCPYNFIFAVRKKLKVGHAHRLKMKSSNQLGHKTNKYCLQTTKFLMKAIRPIRGSQEFSTRLDIKLNLQFLITIPQCQLMVKHKLSKLPNYWKRPKLANALNALRGRLEQYFRRWEGNTRKDESTALTTIETADLNKSESLLQLLRLRKKLLVERTVTLFSWFEMQIEQLKTEERFVNVVEIRKMQDIMLQNMQKERLYINGLMLQHGHNTDGFSTEIATALKGSQQNLSSCSSQDSTPSELKPKTPLNTQNWQHKALDFVLRRHILDQPPGNNGYYNLYLWILKKRVQNGSALLSLFPESSDTSKIVRDLYGNTKETSNLSLNSSKAECQESLIDVVASNYSEKTSCAIPIKQAAIPSKIHNETPNQLKVAEIESFKLSHELSNQEDAIFERLTKDVSLELMQEQQKSLGKTDSPSTLCTKEQTTSFNDPTNFLFKLSKGFSKRPTSCAADHIEKVLIYELYNEDLHWEHKYDISCDVLDALIEELIMQHVRHVVNCIVIE